MQYGPVVLNPVKGLKCFLKTNNTYIFYRETKWKGSDRWYFVRVISVDEFAKNPDDYPRLLLGDKKTEKQEEIFRIMLDLIKLEYFFRSAWCNSLCDIDGDLILENLKKQTLKISHKKQIS